MALLVKEKKLVEGLKAKMSECGSLSKFDDEAIERCARAMYDADCLRRELRRDGYTFRLGDQIKQNPAAQQLLSFERLISDCLKEFQLTPASRTRSRFKPAKAKETVEARKR